MEITVKKLAEHLQLKCISGCDGLQKVVRGVYVSDLLSDVVGHAEEAQLWITLHTHPNIVAVATLKNLSAIIISGGRIPESETIEASEKQQIPILLSSQTTFQLSGQFYRLLYADNEEKRIS
ncbi:MAG: DRTGG domain-containing protein [Bacteroidales bacterium]